ncbi:hypothetical protein FJ251_03935 [bacterium]|nr:hypothetical protein [bacterium]
MSARWQAESSAPLARRPAAPRERTQRRLGLAIALLLLTALSALLAVRPARAALRVEALAGFTRPDADFATFRWDTGPQVAAGGGIALERGPLALGLRLAHHGGAQATGLPAGPAALALDLTSLELSLGHRVAALLGSECWLQGHLGWLRLAYEPERLGLAGAGGDGETLWVDFPAVDTLCGGGGLHLRRGLGRALALGLELDALAFALDSARRVEDRLVEERERRLNWRLGLRLDWFPGA